jgi:hypothetical protein
VTNLWPVQHAGPPDAREIHFPSYLSGYVDGEGCFTVSFSPRPTLRVGWEARPSLSVSQNGDRAEVLLEIAEYFGCGAIRPDRSDQTLKWEVRSLPSIASSVLPHFRRYPLRSGKQRDVIVFDDICCRMLRREHLDPTGLAEIVRLAGQMNPSGRRVHQPAAIVVSLRS